MRSVPLQSSYPAPHHRRATAVAEAVPMRASMARVDMVRCAYDLALQARRRRDRGLARASTPGDKAAIQQANPALPDASRLAAVRQARPDAAPPLPSQRDRRLHSAIATTSARREVLPPVRPTPIRAR